MVIERLMVKKERKKNSIIRSSVPDSNPIRTYCYCQLTKKEAIIIHRLIVVVWGSKMEEKILFREGIRTTTRNRKEGRK